MRLLEINLENYRNIRSANLSFSTDRILFLGKNGQGKTNLLEAIGLSSSLRSFRRSSMEGIIKEGERSAVFFSAFWGMKEMKVRSCWDSVPGKKGGSGWGTG